MKLTKHEASKKERALKAIYKRLEVGEKKKDEATSEGATERRTQQQCILSGGVYLRHRLRKLRFLKNMSALLSPHGYYTPSVVSVQPAACRRTGVQEAFSPEDLSLHYSYYLIVIYLTIFCHIAIIFYH
jgi:hypothetical protein